MEDEERVEKMIAGGLAVMAEAIAAVKPVQIVAVRRMQQRSSIAPTQEPPPHQ